MAKSRWVVKFNCDHQVVVAAGSASGQMVEVGGKPTAKPCERKS